MVTRHHSGDEQPSTILVVDDEPGVRQFLDLVLSAEGFRVVVARDGMEAIHVVQGTSPQLVLTDLMMPRLDGRLFIQWLRDAAVPVHGIIAMSALEEAACPSNADRFVTKPFVVEELLATVRALLADAPPATPAALEAGAGTHGRTAQRRP